MLKKILHKIKLRTWIALAVLVVLSPIGFLILNRIEAAPTPPVAYWKFDEGVDNSCPGGTNDACDSTTNANDAAEANVTWQTEDQCVSGKCLFFNGSTSTLSTADSSSLSQTGSFTISAWIKPMDTTAATLFPIAGKWDSTYQDYLLTLYGDEIRMYVGSSSNYESTDAANLQINTWYHIQGAYNASAQTVTIYINGNAVGSTTTGTIPASITDNSGTFDIGYSSAGGATVNLQVNANDNDGSSTAVDGVWHSYGNYDNSYGNTGMFPLGGEEGDTNSITTGLRFTNVTIPQGNTITTGTLDFKESYGGDYGTNVKNKIYAAAQDDCAIFGASNLPSSMTKTTQNVDWDSNGSQGTAGSWYQASATVPPPDISDIIYEVINRPGWVSGNDICILIENDAGGSSTDWWFEVDPYESGAANAAKLDITYTTSTPGGRFNGFIDEVKVFGAVLSESQAKSEAVGGSAVFGASDTGYLNQGLLGYWKLDESSGNATDSSGNALTLTNNGTTTYTTGKFAHGTEHVPASSQYLSTATTISGVKSVSFWVNPDNTTNHYLSLTSSAYITSSSGTLSATGFTDPKIYVNGVETSSIAADAWQLVTVTDTTAINANQFYIGRQSTNYFDGTFDEVRVYNRTLSPSEVQKLYNWAPGPTGYWPMDENTGQYVYDKSGSGNTGTLGSDTSVQSTDPKLTIGKFGSATNFNGGTSDKFVRIPSATGINFTNENLTVMAWVRRTGDASFSNPMYIVDKINFSAGYELKLAGISTTCNDAGNGGTSACFTVSDGTDTYYMSTTGDGITADSTWHHIAAVFDRNNENNNIIFIDGVAQATTINGTLANIGNISTTRALCFGIAANTTACGSTNEFNGNIDEVKIYNYARTQQQIIEDMNGGHPTGGSPIGSETIYWKFDEMNGTIAHDATQHENGTLYSSPTWSTQSSCKINGCLLFDASGEEVSIFMTNDEDVDFNGSEPFSGSVWIKPTTIPSSNTPRDAIIAKWDETSLQRAYRLSVANESADLDGGASIEVEIFDESTDQSLTATGHMNAVTANQWYHIAFTFNGGTAGAAGDLKLYMNGQLVGQNATNGSFLGLEDVSSDFTVGEYDQNDLVSTNTRFPGYIDEVKIYSGELTPDQIKIDYNAGSTTNFGTGTNEASDLGDGVGNPPIAYWNMDENTGTTSTSDVSGNGYTMTMNGSMTGNDWVPGRVGSALNLDGSNDFLSNASYIQPDKTTVSAWAKFPVNPSGSQRWAIVSNRNGAYDYSYVLVLDGPSGNVWFVTMKNGLAGGYGIAATPIAGSVDDNKWHFYAGTYDGTDVKLYIDGKLMATTNDPSATLYNANNSTYIGRNYDGTTTTYTPGIIDEVKIYDYARTPAQIAYDYNRGAPVAWYKLDECTGTTIYDSAKTANGDATGNNGTWSGATGTNTSAGTCSSGTGSEAWNNGTTGKLNASLDFDGTDDIVTISPSTLTNNLTQVSVTAWIYLNSFGENSRARIVDKNQVLSGGWAFYVDSGIYCGGSNRFDFHHYWSSSTDALAVWCADSNTISTGKWQHVAVTYDVSSASNDAVFYLNGKQVGTTEFHAPTGTTGDDSSINLTLGNKTALDRTFDGQIDDVRIYNYILSESQVKKIMNEGSAVRFGPNTGSP